MKWNDVFCHSFKALANQLGLPRERKPVIDACRADDFGFFRPALDRGLLTTRQMQHACQRYRLGKSKSGRPIFWMIDELGRLQDGHLGDDWVSRLLMIREPALRRYWRVEFCLFGLHLLAEPTSAESGSGCLRPVAIVRREASAVILSELFPEQLWLATAATTCFTFDLLAPLQGRTVVLYPETDETMESYLCWVEIADMARRTYQLDITCSTLLEDHATPEQKARGIDLLDFLLDGKTQ